MVAVQHHQIVGDILFSPATIEAAGMQYPVAGLGPVAVTPARQGQGIGSELVRQGLLPAVSKAIMP